MSPLLSPTSRLPLRPDSPDVLSDGQERWPVVEGIPYLRTGRDRLVAETLAALDAGDREAALVLLLADQDDWWTGPAPDSQELRGLVRDRDALSLRDAMARLAFGRVGDYFAHRWSDPTYLAGLALLDAHWRAPRTCFELACGIGHFLRELARLGVRASGGDVVFAKLWLARHWVVPEAELVCFDAASPWPVAGRSVDLVLCQDAFYFLGPKAEILAALRSMCGPGGVLALGHVHNRNARNHSAGSGLTAPEIAALFSEARVYDDAELTRAAAEGRAPRSRSPAELADVEAFSIVEGVGLPEAGPACGLLCRPADSAILTDNPLYETRTGGFEVVWPSERYRQEYAGLATYRTVIAGPILPTEEAIRRREVVDLPVRW